MINSEMEKKMIFIGMKKNGFREWFRCFIIMLLMEDLVLAGFENFRGSIDPEELFRRIFGDAGLGGMGGFSNFSDFEESKFGFAPASEVGTVDLHGWPR